MYQVFTKLESGCFRFAKSAGLCYRCLKKKTANSQANIILNRENMNVEKTLGATAIF